MNYYDFTRQIGDIVKSANFINDHPMQSLVFDIHRSERDKDGVYYNIELSMVLKFLAPLTADIKLLGISTRVQNVIEEEQFYDRAFIHILAGPLSRIMDYEGLRQSIYQKTPRLPEQAEVSESGQSTDGDRAGKADQDLKGLVGGEPWPTWKSRWSRDDLPPAIQ